LFLSIFYFDTTSIKTHFHFYLLHYFREQPFTTFTSSTSFTTINTVNTNATAVITISTVILTSGSTLAFTSGSTYTAVFTFAFTSGSTYTAVFTFAFTFALASIVFTVFLVMEKEFHSLFIFYITIIYIRYNIR